MQVLTMVSERNHYFSTERLVVDEWHSLTSDQWLLQNLVKVVQEILSESVTKSLPPEWQGSYSTTRTKQWIQKRDEEGVTLLVVDKDNKKSPGFGDLV